MSHGLTGVPQALSYTASVASATTVTLPNAPMDATYPVTGTNTITGITSGQAGRKARLIFQSAGCTVVNGSNLKLAGRSFISTVNRMLTLVSDGTNWVEQSRGAFGTLLPVTQNFGDVAAVGAGGESADIYHVHGMPQPPTPNAIVNGDFSVLQTGNSPSPATNGIRYLDSWYGSTTGPTFAHSQFTVAQQIGNHWSTSMLAHAIVTPDAAPTAGHFSVIIQPIEGYAARSLLGGCALSFWISPPSSGFATGALHNRAETWCYPMEWPVVGGVWNYCTAVIPAFNSTIIGTSNMQTNAGLYLFLNQMLGSTYMGTATGAWQSGGVFGTTNQTNWAATATTTYYWGVNLIPGNQPRPFVPLGREFELPRAMRYREVHGFQATTIRIQGYGLVADIFGRIMPFAVPKGGIPAVTKVGTWNVFNCAQPAILDAAKDNYLLYSTFSTGPAPAAFLADTADDGIIAEWYPT